MNQSFNQSVDRTRIPTPLIISHIFGTLILSQSHRRPTILCMDRVQSVCPFTLGYIWVLFFFKGFIIWDLRGRKATAPQKYDVWFISKCVCVWERVHTIPAVTTCQTHSNQRTSHLSVERPLIPSSLTKSQSDLAARPWRNIQDTVCSRWAYTMKC